MARSRTGASSDWTHQPGRPDGATVDADGYVWNCMVATGQLVRLAPDGRVDRVIQLPVTNPTCPPRRRRPGHALHHQPFAAADAGKLALEPLAGGLFALNVGVKGLPEPRYRG